MSLVISTNTASQLAMFNLTKTNRSLNNSIAKLSSGSRIITADLDPAGLSISVAIESDIRGLDVAKKNAENGVSLLQTADAGLEAISNIALRLKELALQASDATIGSTERGLLNSEFLELVKEIDRVSDSTEFNNIKLLDGGLSAGIEIQVGLSASNYDTITITITDVGSNKLGSTTMLSSITISQSAGRAQSMLKWIDAAMNDINTARSNVGAKITRLISASNFIGSTLMNLEEAHSRIYDVDVASETANFTKNQVLMQAGVSILAQANALPANALALI